MEARVEWHGAVDFAEVAEALGITTTQILAAMNPKSDTVLVLWTATTEEDESDLWSSMLRRDRDGILRELAPTQRHVGMLDDIHAGIDARMREHFGDPPGR